MRILYARKEGLALGAAHEPLGADGNGAWVAMAPAAYLEVVARGWPHRLMWFARADYERAVRALPPAEVSRAVHHRIDTFSAKAAGSTLVPIVAAMQHALAGARPLELGRGFLRLVALVGDGAWSGQPLPQLLDRCLDDVTRLAAELALPEPDADAARELERAHALAARLPSPSLPAMAPERMWAAPREAALEALLARLKRPHAVVGDVVVFPWAAARVAEVAPQARVVHADPGAVEELLAQTPAQRARDLGELVGAGAEALRASSATLRLELRRDVAIRLAWLAPRLDDAVVTALAEAHRDEWLALLRARPAPAAESTLRDELALAVALAKQARLTSLATRAAAALADLDAEAKET